MEYRWKTEVENAKKAAMGELYNIAKKNLTEGEKLINFASGHPDTNIFQNKLLEKYMIKALEEGEKDLLQYGPHIGYEPLRKQFQQFANAKGEVVHKEDEVMVTYGTTEGIFISGNIMLNKGDTVILEEPSYVNAIKAFALSGAKLVSVRQEADGVCLDELEQKMKQGAKIFYTIPNFSNPSGITMSEQKRRAVYEMAVKYDVLIIEDNTYGELRYRGERIKNIKEFDTTGNVVYLCSMSKIVAPAVRMGFLVANKKFIQKAIVFKAVSSNGVTPIIQKALSLLLEENDIYAEIQKISKVYAKKLNVMENAMHEYFPDKVCFSKPDGGMYLWVTMPEGTDIDAFCRECAERLHIPITPGNGFCVENATTCTSMRFNFVKESIDDIPYGIEKVGEFIRGYIC